MKQTSFNYSLLVENSTFSLENWPIPYEINLFFIKITYSYLFILSTGFLLSLITQENLISLKIIRYISC